MRVLYTLILVAVFVIGTLGLEDYYYGVNLGFKEITAARVGPEDEVVQITKIEGSEEYQAHMKKLATNSQRMENGEIEFLPLYRAGWNETAPEEYHAYRADLENDQHILNTTLAEIMEASDEIGFPMNISGISFPTSIDYLEKEHIQQTFIDSPLAPSITEFRQVMWSRTAAKTAYNLDIIGDVLITPHERSSEGEIILGESRDWSSIIFLEYGTSYLKCDLGYIENYVIEFEDSERLAWSESEGIQFRLPVFLVKLFFHTDFALQESSIYSTLENFTTTVSEGEFEEGLVAIALWGEASSEAMNGLRSNLREILPSKWEGLIPDQTDADFVAAIGAAFKGRWEMTVDPVVCEYIVYNYVWDDRIWDNATVPDKQHEL